MSEATRIRVSDEPARCEMCRLYLNRVVELEAQVATIECRTAARCAEIAEEDGKSDPTIDGSGACEDVALAIRREFGLEG